MVKVKKDLTGQRFGRLVVIKQADDYVSPKGNHYAQWECLCDCGNVVIVRTCNLKGKTSSCGCYRKELVVAHNVNVKKKYNKYDLETKEYGVGYTENGDEFWFDKEDYDKIKNYCWYYNPYGYVRSTCNGVPISLHQIVMNVTCRTSVIIDHIVHDVGNSHKYDNRKCNLRIVTKSENAMNQHLHSNNTSGVTGVSWDKSKNMWCAYISYKGKRMNLGVSSNKEDCIKWRKEAEEKYFGEYSFDKSQSIFDEEKGA